MRTIATLFVLLMLVLNLVIAFDAMAVGDYTNDDNGKTINIAIHERFNVSLEHYDWKIVSFDRSVIKLVNESTYKYSPPDTDSYVHGKKWIFEGVKDGKTNLSLKWECDGYEEFFYLNVVVGTGISNEDSNGSGFNLGIYLIGSILLIGAILYSRRMKR